MYRNNIPGLLRQTRTGFTEALRQVFSGQRRPQRLLDEVETLLSVLLAIVFAHVVGAHNVGWAAFSGYMVMRSQLSESLYRGALRMIGTVAGALLAWTLVVWLGHVTALMSLVLALVGGLTMYAVLTRRHSYAWLFTGLTFAMVILDALNAPLSEVHAFVVTRALEVTAGTTACIVVSLVLAWTVRPKIHGRQTFRRPRPEGTGPVWHKHAAISAVQVAICLALLPFLLAPFNGELASQAAVTVMATMIVPLSALTPSSGAVRKRSMLRLAGALLGAGLAAVGLVLSHGNAPATIACMCAGVMLGRHVENSGTRYAYIGTQFALVFLVVFVPDNYEFVSSEPGWMRLVGILLGLLLLMLVRGAGHALGRFRQRAS